MTWAFVLALTLSQAEVKAVEPLPAPVEPPPEARFTPPPAAPAGPSVTTRALLAGAGGALAGGASFGIAVLLVGANSGLDPAFATAALASLMVAGVSFSIHAAMGGRGEITLAFLLSAAVMAGAAALSSAVSGGDRLLGPALIAAIGAVPAAAAATVALEGTSPQPRKTPRVALYPAPNGLLVTF